MAPGGIPTKWRSLVVSNASKRPTGGLKWRIVLLLMAVARVRFVEDNVHGRVAGPVDQL